MVWKLYTREVSPNVRQFYILAQWQSEPGGEDAPIGDDASFGAWVEALEAGDDYCLAHGVEVVGLREEWAALLRAIGWGVQGTARSRGSALPLPSVSDGVFLHFRPRRGD